MHERLFRPKRGYLSTVRVELYSLQTRMAQATTGPARMKSTMVYGQRPANWGAALIDLAEESSCMRPARLSLLTKLLVWARAKPKLWCALGCYRTLTFARNHYWRAYNAAAKGFGYVNVALLLAATVPKSCMHIHISWRCRHNSMAPGSQVLFRPLLPQISYKPPKHAILPLQALEPTKISRRPLGL